MPLARANTWTFLLAAGFALLTQAAAQGQDPGPLPTRYNPATASTITKYKEVIRGGIPAGELKDAQEAFRSFAKYYADVIAHPAVWKAAVEPRADGARIPTIDHGENGILREMDRFLLEPVPGGVKAD